MSVYYFFLCVVFVSFCDEKVETGETGNTVCVSNQLDTWSRTGTGEERELDFSSQLAWNSTEISHIEIIHIL